MADIDESELSAFNLQVLRAIDPAIDRILCSGGQAAIYELDKATSKWVRYPSRRSITAPVKIDSKYSFWCCDGFELAGSPSKGVIFVNSSYSIGSFFFALSYSFPWRPVLLRHLEFHRILANFFQI